MTAWIWKRYDDCAEVNRLVNANQQAESPAAIAGLKAAALEMRGVPAAELIVGELSFDGGKSFADVLVVEDRIARWVLRAGADMPECLPRDCMLRVRMPE